MSFSEHNEMDTDVFTLKLVESLDQMTKYQPIEIDENILSNMRFEEVFIQDYSHLNPKYPKRFFKNLVPDVAI